MAKMAKRSGKTDLGELNFGTANPKQLLFYNSKAMFTAYGGAKGGGKTHAVRVKAIAMCLANKDIRVLIMRCHYPELEENHIRPICKMVPPELASYNATTHLMTFHNGSTIKFGHWSGEESENEYNGLEYDKIFIDEATQFSERAFNFLGGCLRGTSKYQKQMFLTMNPGGIGHFWVKRLFIDRQYKTNCKNPEENENPDDYLFIPATVEDNTHLLESSPTYLRNLAQMPENLRQAYRYGDWDAISGGSYFKEFNNKTHTCNPFKVPEHWPIYRSFDYGLDRFSVGWWAVDEDGRAWLIRAYEEKDLIVQDAAQELLNHTLPSEKISITYAPPDLWNRQKDTGRTMADVFAMNNVPLVRASNNRVQGHLLIKEMLAPRELKDPFVMKMFPNGKAPKKLPGCIIFNTCDRVISDLRDIQADEKNPNDCAKQPHEVTHNVDMIRYFAISRQLAAEDKRKAQGVEIDWGDDEDAEIDYDSYMTGGEASAAYIGAGA